MTSISSPAGRIHDRLEDILAAVPLADRIDPTGELSERMREEAAALRFWFARRNDPGLPSLTVLFGCSGVGKSTLFNALTGGEHAFVSSVERPATRGAIVAGRPEVIARIARDDLFPTFESLDLDAKEEPLARGREGRLLRMPCPDAREGLVVDCPDFDTRVDENRHIATRLLSWADRVVFVTSTERYADRSAAPYLERIGRARLDAIFVLNMVEEDEGALLDDYAQKLRRVEGLDGVKPLALPRSPRGAIAETSAFAEVLVALEQPIALDRGQDRFRELARRLRADLLEPLRREQVEREAALRVVERAPAPPPDFRLPEDLDRLRAFEAATKPILKIGPRPAWKLLKTLITPKEGRAASTEETPELPEREQLEASLIEPAWRNLEGFQIEVRNALDGTALRHLLTDGRFADAEFGREEVGRRLAPVADRLLSFSDNARKRLAARATDAIGPGAKLRLFVLDRTLAVLGLLMTLTVLPAVIHETLARMGMKDFVNEIDEVLKEARSENRALIETLIRDQRERYLAYLRAEGPDEEALLRLGAALSEEKAS